jgi:hypothetical protein
MKREELFTSLQARIQAFSGKRDWDHFRRQKNLNLKGILSLAIALSFLIPSQISLMYPANAAKTGSVCKKLNLKDWDGNTPIVCKRSKSGKLVWTKFTTVNPKPSISSAAAPTPKPSISSPAAPTPKPVINTITIVAFRPNVFLVPESAWAQLVCDSPSSTPFTPQRKDINSSTAIEIRDSQNTIVGIGQLGISRLVYPGVVTSKDGVLSNIRGICIFKTTVQVKDSDFYQVKIGNLGSPATVSKSSLQTESWTLRYQFAGDGWNPNEVPWLAENILKY